MNLYKKSGVDVEKAEGLVGKLKKQFPGIGGGYAGSIPFAGQKLAATCDGVGTKISLAVEFDRHEVVGEDLVAMSINDLIAGGAQPLFFLDYFSCGKLNEEIFMSVMKGIESGMEKSQCLLIGGETAEMPDMYKGDDYDLAGFACGTVLKEIDKETVNKGDVIIGLESNGIHSNGFSLVRKIFSKEEIAEQIDIIMQPTRIYSEFTGGEDGREMMKSFVKSMAHVTGGGTVRALKRLLPVNLKAKMCKFELPDIFSRIEQKGIERSELENVFNMGWGMLCVVEEKNIDEIIGSIGGKVIGEVID